MNETLINKGIREAKIISESVCFARDIGNEPSSVIFPEALSEIVKDRAKKYNFQLQVLNKEEILKQKMGGVIAVSKGSTNEPRFLILKYLAAPGDNKPVVLIGKGVTFDSGGISLKPGTGMSEMKMDMCGAAAVIAAVEAAARLKLKVNIIGLVPLVENMPDGSALKPGDIVKSHNGKYIEVDNTDAEGRIILADALSFAGTFKPSYVVDLATLTGAAIIVLGHIGIPAMGNDPVLLGKFKKAGEETYERIWELPLWDEYDRMIEADTGDVLNVGPPRQAGTIIAGTFLKKFIGNYKWLHLDIAGTAIMPKPSYYISKNASGSGVRLLIRFLFNELNL